MSFIHQELAFVPGMTVLQNIMLGLPKKTRFGLVDWPAIARDIEPIAKRVGVTAPLNATSKGLSTAENWLINITRALVRKARLIVMDEPTASLSAGECQKLFAIIRDLSASGVAVLYVSHRLDEVLDLCGRVTVFRDGRSVAELAGPALTRRGLVEAIVGGAVESLPKARREIVRGEAVLSVRRLAAAAEGRGGELRPASRRGAWPRRPGRRRSQRTGPPDLRRRPAGWRRNDARRQAVRAKDAGRGGARRPRPGPRRAANRGAAAHQIRRLQHQPRQSECDRCERHAALHQLSQARQAGRGDDPRPRDQGAVAGSAGRPAQRRQPAESGDRPLAAVGAESADPRRADARRRHRRARRDPSPHPRTGRPRAWPCSSISSEPDELPDLCDRVLVMAEGRIVRELAGERVTRSAIIEASYAASEERVPA